MLEKVKFLPLTSQNCTFFGIRFNVIPMEQPLMATQTQKKPPYTFRAGWAILLLAINFLVAAIYAHLINI